MTGEDISVVLDNIDKDDIINYILDNYYNEMKEAIQEQAS